MKVRLGDVATYINGYAFKPEDWSDSGLPIIRIQDLTGNSYKTNRFSGKYDKKFEVNDGDILISWSASIGVYVWRGEKAVLNQHIFKVKFDKQVNICKKFFIYQVENILKKAILETHGATMKHLTKPVFDSLPFYLPDIKKQNEISAILDKISEIISLRQRQLKKLDELVKSRFIEMFGEPDKNTFNWSKEKLGEHLDVVNGFAFKSEGFTDIGIPVLRIGNINSGTFKATNMVFWPNDATLFRYKIYPGDLVISLTGTVGKDDYGNVCILGTEYKEYYLNQRNAKLDIKNTINKYYLSQILKFNEIKNQLTGISRGVRQANISIKDILSLSVPIPPIELQDKFADFVKQTDKSKLEIQKSLDKLEILKKSLMQEYFS